MLGKPPMKVEQKTRRTVKTETCGRFIKVYYLPGNREFPAI